MLKICVNCNKNYEDLTKRKVGKTCSKTCASFLMTKTRKQNESYKMTEEQKEKISFSIKESYKNGSRKITIEKAIESVRDKTRTKERIRKQKQTNLKKYGTEHWSQTIEGKRKISKIHSGKICSPEQIKKMSIASRKKLKNQNVFSFSKKGIRDDLNCFFRSTWEANYARYLNFIGEKWAYESKTYELGEGISYTPDFILENGTHIEIKGWLTEKGLKKLNLFQNQYPFINFIFVGKKEYIEIKAQYQFIIANWEK